LRVVLDPSLSLPRDAKVFAGGGAIVFAAGGGGGVGGAVGAGGLRIERVASAPRGLDLHAVLRRLVDYEVNELLVECGPRLAGAFLRERLVDELILYVAPHFLGDDAAPLAALSGAGLTQLPRFEFQDVRRIGPDLRLVLTPKGA
jgi:diaminohydroxyphosphoribosylaminopyrimidine deaminase/5-amino-6-(5-phosphoribosylamino)uracil reductase